MIAASVLAGAYMVLLKALLVEPIVMQVLGPCDGDATCTEVRCVFENQGPVPARGTVVIDTWLAADAASGRPFSGVRRTLPVALMAGERVEHVLRADGVPYISPSTMVRCMPGYVTGGYPLQGS